MSASLHSTSNFSSLSFFSPLLLDYGPLLDLKCLCEMVYGVASLVTLTFTDARRSVVQEERWKVVLEINGEVRSVAVANGERLNAARDAVDIALAELILENDAR